VTDPRPPAPARTGWQSPVIDGDSVTFGLADPHRRLRAVRLLQEIGLPGPHDLTRISGGWCLRMPMPPVDRMEYLYEIVDHNGRQSTMTDPANPRRAGGAFGDRSEARLPGYRPPEWLTWPQVDAAEADLHLDTVTLGQAVTGRLWHPRPLPAREPAPLVVVHDGPEYAALGNFTGYLSAAIATGALPPLRAALLGPGDRNLWYSANPAYASALAGDVLAVFDRMVNSTVRVGVGVSLGGLALLHAHRSFPRLFDAMLLQSGSFFTPDTDPQERGFSGFGAVTAFVDQMRTSANRPVVAQPERQLPTVLTCGLAEENLANNRAMSTTLLRLGYPCHLVEVRDSHNYTAWRDALHPHFTDLLANLVNHRAA
jgi:enterochelin esterase family protein